MIEPVITKEFLFRQVRSKIEEIAETIYNLNFHALEPGLMGGKSGIVLFLVNHAKIFRCDESADLAFALLNDIIEEANKKNGIYTFSDGLAGIGWLMVHLEKYDMIEFDGDNGLDDIDKSLSQLMIYDLSEKNYDFLHGGLGYGMYFLERYFQNNNSEFLELLVAKLEETGLIDDKGGHYWETDIHLDKVIHGVNLGMAHGLPSIIAFLSKVHHSGAETDTSYSLITGAMKYLARHMQDPELYRSCFPNYISKGTPANSRLAWCYGDPGIGLAFLHTADVIQVDHWKKESKRIFQINSSRRSPEDDYVLDTGLCHGTAGLAQIYNHAFQETGEELFQETAEFWIRKTLEMANHHDGLAGFRAYRPPQSGGWTNEPGLLEGIAGTGLALMTSISNEDTEWDRCLLIN